MRNLNSPASSAKTELRRRSRIATACTRGVLESLEGRRLLALHAAAIGDFVWNDVNANGIQDNSEGGVAGATVQLFTPANAQVGASQVTAADGLYEFDVIVPDAGSDYYVKVTPPVAYAFTLKDQGGNDEKDSDADTVTGKMAVTHLDPDEEDFSWDAGLVIIPPDVGVTKDDGVTSVVPGTTTTYTIVVTNNGPSTATNVGVSDPLPAGVTSFNWSGNGHSNVSGPINDTIATMPSGSSVTYTLVATISPSATGSVTNTVTTTTPNDTNPNNNSASDTDTLTPHVDVGVTKNDGVTSVVPGTSTTYTMVVSNNGPSTATNVAVSDLIPAGVTSFSWSGNGHSNVSGPISDTIAILAPSGSVTYTLVAAISPSATGSVTNTVTTTTANDTNPNNDSASDTDTLTPQVDVAVTKTDGVTNVVPGTSTTYTIVVSNNGPSTATNIAVSDLIPAGVSSFHWSGNGHSNVSGAISDTIASLVPGDSVTYTLIAAIDPAATGSVTNTVTTTTPNDTNSNNDSASDTDTLTPQVDLAVLKDDGKTTVVPGTMNTYTITVTNNGPSTVTSLNLTDTIPPSLMNPVFGAPSSGVYNPMTGAWTGLNLASGQSVSITLMGIISPSATGTISNTSTVSPPPGVTDTNSTNDTASDTDTLTPQFDVSVTKDDGVLTVTPGSTTTYTIVVKNSSAGPSTAHNVAVNDPVPAGVASFSWSGNGHSNVSGPINDTIVSLAPGASVTYTLVATISNPVPTNLSTITNKVTISATGDTNNANNSATDVDGLPAPDCDDNYYPYTGSGSTLLTAVAFSESDVLRAASNEVSDGTFKLWYNDEHAMAMGVRQVTIKTTSGTTVTNYPVSPMGSNPGSVSHPLVGGMYVPPASPSTVSPAALAASQPQGNTDVSGRPLFPSLYLTDITNFTPAMLASPAGHAGDWQYGGKPIAPSDVFGTWKAFTEVIDKTRSTPVVTLTADADPAVNNWNLGAGSDAPPAGLSNEGYGAEARWSLSDLAAKGLILPGHAYRFYVMDHDGDQNKTGGDAGQACFDYYYAGPVQNPSTMSGVVYNDKNNNKIKDAAETGIAGVAVSLFDVNLNLITTVTTDSTGGYQFKNLPAGNYRIVESQPTGYIDGRDTLGSLLGTLKNDKFSNITVPASSAGTGYNFGEIVGSSAATSTVSKSFNSTAIATSNTLWLSSVVTMSGLSSTGSTDVTLRLVNASVTITTKTGTVYTVPVPNAKITFKSSITDATASTNFNSATNTWETTIGKTTAGNTFLSAIPWTVPAGNLAGASFKMTGTFIDDSTAVDVSSWAAAAAVYNTTAPAYSLPSDPNMMSVKPTDSSAGASPFNNTDRAGTPEFFKMKVIVGALGTGGTNYIGGYTSTGNPTDIDVLSNLSLDDATESFLTSSVNPLT